MDINQIICIDDKGKPVLPPNSKPFDELCDNIRRNGLRIPIYVNQKRRIIFGHFRFCAAVAAGLKDVPVRFAESIKEVDLARDGAPLVNGPY